MKLYLVIRNIPYADQYYTLGIFTDIKKAKEIVKYAPQTRRIVTMTLDKEWTKDDKGLPI